MYVIMKIKLEFNIEPNDEMTPRVDERKDGWNYHYVHQTVV